MAPQIRALWRDADRFEHRLLGLAFTLRYVPSSRTIVAQNVADFQKQEREWYREAPGWSAEIQEGDVIVIDGTGTHDTGYVGSANSLGWLAKGAIGVVTNSGVRDTDELIKQKVRVYCDGFSRGIIPGRIELESYQKPVECGGVCVRPGDLVVGDGDGVTVIPAETIDDALPIAREIQRNDQKGRARRYKELGIPSDFTLGDAAGQVGEG